LESLVRLLPYLLVAIAFLGALWQEWALGTPAHAVQTVVVALLLVPLIIMKYTNFIYQDVLGLFLGPMPRLATWAFPLGISFITFTMVAYVVDVYRGRFPLEHRAGLLTGLVLFFPHLIAGPILRPADLIPQLANPYGLWRMHKVTGETENVSDGGIRKTAHVKCGGDEPVIWVFGGSTTFGQGTPDWENIPSNLA
jgi:D-alanyl-lipoteichoic acid acyltransferase DltB (MBOAT superfamily)